MLFEEAEFEKMAQFFVYGIPDSNVCGNYYCVSDRDALCSLNPFKTCGRVVKRSETSQNSVEGITPKTKKKTPLKMLLRELVWLLGRWKNKALWDWLDDFRPEKICLFLANNTFLIRLAIQCAKRYQIPVIAYTTEGYCFMDFNYLTNRPSLCYRLYYIWLRRMYKKITPLVAEGYFNSTLLRDRYEAEFHYPCKCVMNSSQIDFVPRVAVEADQGIRISYLGNLGLGRHLALIEIAQALQELNPAYCLDIYGATSNDGIIRDLEKCRGIYYHGFVSYSEVIQVIHSSTLLVHTEWNDAITNRDLKYAFSTKIADSISSGTPLLIYADESLAETSFLRDNQCAFIVSDKKMLKDMLYKALTDEACRCKIIENAKKAKEKYLTGNKEFLQAFE